MPYSSSGPGMAKGTSQWDKRVERAVDLADRFAFAAEVLGFYAEVLRLQRSIFNELSSQPKSSTPSETSFRESLNVAGALRFLPALLSLAEEKGPAKLAEDAGSMRQMPAADQQLMLRAFLAGDPIPYPFFARALLQPCAEALAQTSPASAAAAAGSRCPRCGEHPQAAVLHPEGEGGKRFLLCSLCLTEWEFRRVLCPICREEDYRKLPRYTAEEHPAVRVEGCDTCHFYLKSIDMTVDGHAVPLVDEVAMAPLDVWASEHGYKRPVPNLMGF